MFRASRVVLLLSFIGVYALADEEHRIVGTRLLPNGSTASLVQIEGSINQSIVSLSGTPSHPKVSVFGVNASGRYLIRLKDQPIQPIIKNMKQHLRVVGVQPNQSQAQQIKTAAINQKLLITNNQNKLISRLTSLQSLSKVHYKFSELTNTISVTLKESDLDAVRLLPEVEGIYRDNRITINLADSVAQTKAPDVWSLKDESGFAVTGRGIKVAILDTGIDYTHPDLGGCVGVSCKVRLGRSFVEGKPSDDFMDRHGHGTHVAGIVAANGALKGVAPDALLYAFKVLDDSGSGQDSGIIAALEKAVNPDGDLTTDDGADVINMSLGGYGAANSPLSEAANTAMNAGAMVVVAAGNTGPSYQTLGSPGNAEKVLTVGAIDKHGAIAYFSSRGPVVGAGYVKPEVMAPGVDINSLKPGNGYAILSGTSMATPHVAGAAALMLQLHPSLKPEDIKSLLMTSAHGIGEDVFTQGAGAIDLKVAASLQWIIQNPLKFVGNVDVDAAEWEQPFTLNIKNISQQPVRLEFNAPNAPISGLSFSLPVSPAVLEPLTSTEYQFKARVDNAVLGFPANESLHFENQFSVKSGLNDIKVSAVLLKSAKLTVQASFGLYSVMLIGQTAGELNQTYRENACGALPEPYDLYVKPGVYDALLYYCDGSIVAKELLKVDKALIVEGSSDEATSIMDIEKVKLLDGRVLSADSISPYSGVKLLFHDPSKTGIYAFHNASSGSKIKLSPMSKRFKFSAGILYKENTPNWSDLYFVNWYRPDGVTQGESRTLDLKNLVELDFRYADTKMVQQGVLDNIFVSEINPFSVWGSFSMGTYNYPFTEAPLQRKIYSEPTTLAESEFALNIEVEKKDPDYILTSIAATDYIGFLSQTDLMKFSSPFFPLQSGPHVFPNKGLHLDGNGYFFPLLLRYYKDFNMIDELDASNFLGWSRASDEFQNRFYDVIDFKTYCDDNLLISGKRPLSPYPEDSARCDILKIERRWENRYLDKVGDVIAVQQLDIVRAKRSGTTNGRSTPLLETLVFLNGSDASRVLNSTDPKVKFSFKDEMGRFLTDKKSLSLELKLDDGSPWQLLNAELSDNYFVASLPVLQGSHMASLRIKYKGAGRSYIEQTLNNVFVLGTDIVASVPRFSALTDIVIEATSKLTPVILPDVYATDSKYGKIKATTTDVGPYPLGTNTILWNAKNITGMAASASQILVVRDTTSPTVFAPVDILKEATGKETAVNFGFATATDIVDGMTLATTANDGTAFKVGEHYVEWKAVDSSGNIGSAIQVVTIKDTTAPVVRAPEAIVKEATGINTPVTLGQATAIDLVDGEVQATTLGLSANGIGEHNVVWSATDTTGNTGTDIQKITIKDTAPPTVVAPPAINITTKTFPIAVNLGIATATDIVDGALTPVASELGPFNEGQYVISWAVKDKAGNVGTATQSVTVTREIVSNNNNGGGGGGGGGGGSASIALILLLFAYNLWLLRKKYYELRLRRI